jgi:hypothetical protein
VLKGTVSGSSNEISLSFVGFFFKRQEIIKPIKNKSIVRNNDPATISIVFLFDASLSMFVAGLLY